MLRSGIELATRGQPLIVREEETEVVDQFTPERSDARGAGPRGEAS